MIELDELEQIKELLKIENKKNKMLVTEYRLFGTFIIMTKNKYSKSMDKVKK